MYTIGVHGRSHTLMALTLRARSPVRMSSRPGGALYSCSSSRPQGAVLDVSRTPPGAHTVSTPKPGHFHTTSTDSGSKPFFPCFARLSVTVMSVSIIVRCNAMGAPRKAAAGSVSRGSARAWSRYRRPIAPLQAG